MRAVESRQFVEYSQYPIYMREVYNFIDFSSPGTYTVAAHAHGYDPWKSVTHVRAQSQVNIFAMENIFDFAPATKVVPEKEEEKFT